MDDRVLVTYASRSGTTAGVAEAIGQTLAGQGLPVDVVPMQDVKDLSRYRAVVAGSAVQAGAWLPEAMQLVRTHRAELAQKPFAAFLVCMTLAMKGEVRPEYRQHVSTWLGPVRERVRPVSKGLFAGALDTRKIPTFVARMKFRISILLGVWAEGDHRDWDAIRAWGE